MVEAYIDESGIHRDSAICVVAGYFGDQKRMESLGKAWDRTLAKHEFLMREFHASELVGNPKYGPMLEELTLEISTHKKVHPVSSGIIVKDFLSFPLRERRFMTGATIDLVTRKFLSSGCPSKPYFLAFQNSLKTVTDHAPPQGYAHFAFGCDRPCAGYARELFKQIKKQTALGAREWSAWKSTERLGDPSFPLAAQTAQLQAADLFANLLYRHMSECIRRKRALRMPTLLASCMKNFCHTTDNRFQNRECLYKTLEDAHFLLDNAAIIDQFSE